MREQTNKILKTLCVYMLVISMMLSSLVGSWDVMAAGIPEPTVNPVLIGNTTISGGNVHKAKVKVGKKTVNAIATVHVTLKAKDGTPKATFPEASISSKNWSVNLPKDVKVAEGDTVTVYQQIGEDKSSEVNVTAQPSKASTVTLTMPKGEIWIEQTSSNQVNEDEQAEAVQMFNAVNTAIAGDIKSVVFSIDTAEHAYYEVTYTDGSTSGKIEAPDLKIKQVTDYSRGATLGSITIVDNVIKGQLAGSAPFDGIKVQILLKLSDAVKDSYCDKGKCLVDKDTSNPVDATVDVTTGEFTYNIPPDIAPAYKLKQGNIVGVSVKEPHKFKSCSQTPVIAPIPEKTDVRDPRKLTEDDKTAIINTIKEAYKAPDGASKLPNGTGDWDGVPAVIQIDDSGNVKIFSGNDVKGNWDPNNGYKFVPETNEDGSYVLNDGAEPKITIPAKDLVKNLKPDAPTVELSKDKKNITITPNKVDTDASKVEVTYTGKDGSSKTVTATKGQDGNWTTDDTEVTVDSNGVVTLPKKKVKSKTTVSAKVTDAGGIAEGDTDAKTSEPGSVELTASVQTPAVTVDETTGDVTVTPKDNDEDAKRLFITYTPANGTEKTVEAKKDNDGKWSITGDSDFVESADGKSFTIKNAKAKEKTKVKAITKGETDDIKSEVAENTVPDKTAPQAPEVKVNTSNGNAEITPPTDPDTKTVIVKYPDPSGTGKTVTATKDNNVWTITEGAADGISIDSSTGKITIAYANMKKADTVSATAKDDSGNESKSSTDTTLPPVPTVEVSESKDITVTPPTTEAPAVDGMEISYTPANATETNTIKVKKGNDSKWTIEGDTPEGVSINQDSGVVNFAKGTAKDDTKVSALSKIGEDKKGLETAEKQVPDTTAPEAPTVKVQEDGSVTITPKAGSDTKTVTVTYKDQDSADKTATATKGDNGEWTVTGENGETIDKTTGVITIQTGKYKTGLEISAIAKDKAENKSEEGKDTPVEVSFNGNTGTGSITSKILSKGEKYTLPENGFTAPKDKKFAGWKVGEEDKKPGDKITVSGDTEVKAVWEDKTTTPDKPVDPNKPGTDPSKPGQDPNNPDQPGTDPSKPGEEPGVKPSPDTQVYNPWWPIWFGSSEVKPATPAEPKVEYERGLHRKYLYGYKDHTVRPEGLITRAEAAALIARLAELDMSNNMKPNFKDTKSAWYNTAINAVVAKNLMFADKDGDFRPNEPITRGEFARALFFIDKKNNAVAPFADVKGHVYEEAINQAYGNDRIKGYPDGTFKPDATITRAEAATILNNYADRNVTFKGMVEVHKDVVKFTDINESHWAYYEIMEAANTHEYQREKGTIPETWLEILKK